MIRIGPNRLFSPVSGFEIRNGNLLGAKAVFVWLIGTNHQGTARCEPFNKGMVPLDPLLIEIGCGLIQEQ